MTGQGATETLTLAAGGLTLSALRRIARDDVGMALTPGWRPTVEAAARTIAKALAADKAVYGVNTGFGPLATTRIDRERLRELQTRLVLSHSAGVGEALAPEVVRLVLALKIGSLARGHSGVRPELIEALLALFNRGVLPVIPAKGSVGASGDLAPLAHLAAVLIGAGEAMTEGIRLPAAEALSRAGLAPVVLEPKEGLALLNGTQVSTALALAGLFAIEDAFHAALIAGAMSVDAIKGSDVPFDPRINAVRGQPAQAEVAAVYRALIAGSRIRASHIDCERVQDPYSIRCQPQVMGASLALMRHAAETLAGEANGVSDNPLVFADTDEVLSGGNFHGEPVAFAADTLALAIAEIGAMAERRIALLTDARMSGLPPFLVRESGVNSGFMAAHITAAALASENKQLASPASVDSLPTSANQEDHVSMAAHGARRLAPMAENAATVVAIELLAAAQGIDFHRPMETSAPLAEAHARIRARVPFYEGDRTMAPDIEAAKSLVVSGGFADLAGAELVPSRQR